MDKHSLESKQGDRDELEFGNFIDEGQTTYKRQPPKSCDIMNEYIFYTPEGYTATPNENFEVENCQVLGFAKGKDKVEAKENLLKENPWIIEGGFCPAIFITKQLVNEE